MRDAPLTVMKGGINRLRTRGGARADNLYDLVNGYLTEDGTVAARPGTRRVAVLDETTRGITYFNGSRHTFAAAVVAVPTGYTLHILVHPDQESGQAVIHLKRIHFAEPFLGYLYVVAEFTDGVVCHYWLQSTGAWEANKAYNDGDMVEPTTPNGLAYEASRLSDPNPTWEANTAYEIGDVVEPTEYNDFYYTVVETTGANPTSASTEPAWPTEDGEQVTEEVDGDSESVPQEEDDESDKPDRDTQDRYS